MFVLDMSSSVGAQNFVIMKNFVKSVVQVLDIGPDRSKVGVITFSRIPYLNIHLDDYINEKDVLDAIDRIPYQTGRDLEKLRRPSLRQKVLHLSTSNWGKLLKDSSYSPKSNF